LCDGFLRRKRKEVEDGDEQEVVVNWLLELLHERFGEPVDVSVVAGNDLISFLVLLLHPLG
jgi:hypothetical protein